MKHRARKPVAVLPRVLSLLAVSALAFLGIALILNQPDTPVATLTPATAPAAAPPIRPPDCSALARADIHPPRCPRRPAQPSAAAAGKKSRTPTGTRWSVPSGDHDVQITVRIYDDK